MNGETPPISSSIIADIIVSSNIPDKARNRLLLGMVHMTKELSLENESQMIEFTDYARSHIAIEKLYGESTNWESETKYLGDLGFLHEILSLNNSTYEPSLLGKVFANLQIGILDSINDLDYLHDLDQSTERTVLANHIISTAINATNRDYPDNYSLKFVQNLVTSFESICNQMPRLIELERDFQETQDTLRTLRTLHKDVSGLFFILSKIPGSSLRIYMETVGFVDSTTQPDDLDHYLEGIKHIRDAIAKATFYYLHTEYLFPKLSIQDARDLVREVKYMDASSSEQPISSLLDRLIFLANKNPDMLFYDIFTECQRDALETFLLSDRRDYPPLSSVSRLLDLPSVEVRRQLQEAHDRYVNRENLCLFRDKTSVSAKSPLYQTMQTGPDLVLETCGTLLGNGERELLIGLSQVDQYSIPNTYNSNSTNEKLRLALYLYNSTLANGGYRRN